eukprot:snap_masked-scaffold_12-processed-gene-2.24-mRNA-1 protein AED:1.00 eAED:1.00 QI:0/-1/0/0/-1/1/1/0/59
MIRAIFSELFCDTSGRFTARNELSIGQMLKAGAKLLKRMLDIYPEVNQVLWMSIQSLEL